MKRPWASFQLPHCTPQDRSSLTICTSSSLIQHAPGICNLMTVSHVFPCLASSRAHLVSRGTLGDLFHDCFIIATWQPPGSSLIIKNHAPASVCIFHMTFGTCVLLAVFKCLLLCFLQSGPQTLPHFLPPVQWLGLPSLMEHRILVPGRQWSN